MDTSQNQKSIKKKVPRAVFWGPEDPTPNVNIPGVCKMHSLC